MRAIVRRDPSSGWVPEWFWLYLAMLLAGTLSPLAFTPEPFPVALVAVPSDLALNLAAFLPFGWALRRWGLWRVVLAAALVSSGIEVTQRWLPRAINHWDVIMNTAGAALGTRLGRVHLPRILSRSQLRGLGVLTLAAAAAVLAVLARQTAAMPPNDFSNWIPQPAMIGVEEIGEPQWQGVLRWVRIYNRPVRLADVDPPQAGRSPRPIAILRFDGKRAEAWLDTPGSAGRTLQLSPEDQPGFERRADGLAVGPDRYLLPEALEQHVRRRVMQSSALSIAMRLKPAPEPAPGQNRRIIAFSGGYQLRNLGIGQVNGKLYMRVRTTLTGVDEEPVLVPLPKDGGPVTLLGVANRLRVSVQTDRERGQSRYTMGHHGFIVGTGFVLSHAVCVALCVLGLGALLGPPAPTAPVGARLTWRLAILTVGAVIAAVGLHLTGLPHKHAINGITTGLPLLGVLAACAPLLSAMERVPRAKA